MSEVHVTDETECVFETYTGSRYEIRKCRIRRVNPLAEKRADGEWVVLVNRPVLEIGQPAHLVMESLAGWGMDDLDTTVEERSPYTTRMTSYITGIEVRDEVDELPN